MGGRLGTDPTAPGGPVSYGHVPGPTVRCSFGVCPRARVRAGSLGRAAGQGQLHRSLPWTIHVYTCRSGCADPGGLRAVRQRVAAVFGPFLRQIIVNAFLKWCVTA